MAQTNEFEVFRLILKEGCYYQTTTFTRFTGLYQKATFYSTNELQYVGKFIKTESIRPNTGNFYHDSDETIYWAVFDNNGKKVNVEYTYEGTTCFIQVYPKMTPELKDQIIKNSIHIPSLKSLASFQLSTEEIRLATKFGFFN